MCVTQFIGVGHIARKIQRIVSSSDKADPMQLKVNNSNFDPNLSCFRTKWVYLAMCPAQRIALGTMGRFLFEVQFGRITSDVRYRYERNVIPSPLPT